MTTKCYYKFFSKLLFWSHFLFIVTTRQQIKTLIIFAKSRHFPANLLILFHKTVMHLKIVY